MAAMGGCGAGAGLQTRVASLEKSNRGLRDQVKDLDARVQILLADEKARKKENIVACMRNLLIMSPEWKQRFHLETLDFLAGGDMNVGMMAQEDVAEGHINYLTGGLTGIWGPRQKDLRSKCGIWIKHIANVNDGDAIFRLIKAYNAVSKAAIREKFGKDFYEHVFVKGGAVPDQPKTDP